MTREEAFAIADQVPGSAVIEGRDTGEILVVRRVDLGFWLRGRAYRCLWGGAR